MLSCLTNSSPSTNLSWLSMPYVTFCLNRFLHYLTGEHWTRLNSSIKEWNCAMIV